MTDRLNPDDRVLVLRVGSLSTLQLREWAQALTVGLLVGLDDISIIGNARRELADCENTLFAPGSRHEIPWRGGFFTVIFDASGEVGASSATPEPTNEMLRVLHPSGRIYSIQP